MKANVWFLFNPFKFGKRIVLPRIWSILVNAYLSLRRVCILLLLNEIVSRCPWYPVDWWCCWDSLCHYCFLPPIHFWERSIENSKTDTGFIYFSLQLYQFLPHIVWCSVVKHVHVKVCYIFLENWPIVIM